MSTTNTPGGKLREGDWVHFTRTISAWGDLWLRGSSVQLSADHIARTIDTTGRSWLDEIDTEGARIGRGEWPAGEPTWVFGDPDWAEQREAARRRAWAILDPAERAAAREAVEREYGPAPSTSNTIANLTTSPEQRAAAEQRARLDAEGVRSRSNYSPNEREV